MEYFAKSAWNESNVCDKVNRGAKNIEIQLLSPETDTFFDNEKREQALPREYYKYIRAIHPPLIKSKTDFLSRHGAYETSIDIEGARDIIDNICKIADSYEELKKIIIVLHLDMTIPMLHQYNLYHSTLGYVRHLADTYPDMIFVIENTTSMASAQPFYFLEFARRVERPNVKACLDTCHAQMTITRVLSSYNESVPIISMRDYFKEGQDIIGLIHLSQAKIVDYSIGAGKGHGCPFLADNEEDKKLLTDILYLYNVYELDCPVTIEVNEKEYTRSENFSKTLECCKKAETMLSNKKSK